MPDTDKPSLFQGLRNLIGNLFQGGKVTTPEQPVNTQAPPAQPQSQQGMPDADINARMAQMGAVADNVAPGTYTDPNVINSQNVAANAVTGANPVTANVAPEQTGMFGGGQSGAGFMAQSELGGLSGGTAMPATEGQPTDVAGAEANTGTIPAGVVKPVATTPVIYPGTKTAVTPQASGDLPLNFSFEEDLTAKGKQAGGDVQSQALMEMAQQAIQRGDYGGAEAMLRRPLTNQDFFAGPGMRESRTAWGDPIFTGEGQLFPMAVLDARQKAQAQVRNMAIEEDVLNMTIPTVNVAGLRENYSRDFVADNEAWMREGIKRDGSARNFIRNAKKSGEWAKQMSKWKAIAEAINTTGTAAEAFLKNAREKILTGDVFVSPEAMAAALSFQNGINDFAHGYKSPEQLVELQDMFVIAESWDKYLGENIKNIKAIDRIPDFNELDNAENRAKYAEYIKKIPIDKQPGYEDWLVVSKVSEVAKPQVISSLIMPFMRSNPLAMKQFQKMYEGLGEKDIVDKVAQSVSDMFGKQYATNMISRRPTGKGTTFNFGSGGGKEKQGFWESTVLGNNDITTSLNKNIKDPNLTTADVIEQSFGGSWRVRPNDPYVRVAVPGQQYKGTVTPERYNDYVMPTSASGTGAESGQYAPIGKDKNGKDILEQFGITDRNQTPKTAKIVDAEMGYAVRDPRTNQWNLITQENLRKNGLPPGAKQVVIEAQLLYNSPIEEIEEGDGEVAEAMEKLGKGTGKTKRGEAKGLKAYRIYEATLENTRHLDNATNPTTSNEGAIKPGGNAGGFSGSITVEDAGL